MAEITYLDFDVQIERAASTTAGAYRIQVLGSPAGQAAADVQLPFSDLELENILLRLGHVRRGVRGMDSPEDETAKSFGGRLFAAVFNGDVQRCLSDSLDRASHQGVGLRIRGKICRVWYRGLNPYNASACRIRCCMRRRTASSVMAAKLRARPGTLKVLLGAISVIVRAAISGASEAIGMCSASPSVRSLQISAAVHNQKNGMLDALAQCFADCGCDAKIHIGNPHRKHIFGIIVHFTQPLDRRSITSSKLMLIRMTLA